LIAKGQSWKHTVFRDEKRLSFDGSDNWSSWIHDADELHRMKRQMSGGSVIVCSMVLLNGFIHLERLEGRVTNVIYRNMLGRCSLPFLDNIYGKGNYFFQQDNASIHICKATIAWFQDHKIKLLDWLSCSPDITLVENVWKMLLDIVYDRKQFARKNYLWSDIQEASQSIMDSKRLVIQDMFNKYNSRLLQVIDVKGKTIK